MPLNTFPVILEESFMITSKVKHFIFKNENPSDFHYIPGQFITVHFEHQQLALKRSYSIANEPNSENRIEFAAGYFANGPGTEYLYQLRPGDQITISGPYGRLVLKDSTPKRYILVATSTGITPYRAMLSNLEKRLKNQSDLEVVIIQGVQRREEVLYAKDFKDFVARNPNAKFYTYLSRHPDNELSDYEFIGYVQLAFPGLNLNSEQDVVYLCGNPGMIDESFNYLQEQGFPIIQIIREKYISR